MGTMAPTALHVVLSALKIPQYSEILYTLGYRDIEAFESFTDADLHRCMETLEMVAVPPGHREKIRRMILGCRSAPYCVSRTHVVTSKRGCPVVDTDFQNSAISYFSERPDGFTREALSRCLHEVRVAWLLQPSALCRLVSDHPDLFRLVLEALDDHSRYCGAANVSHAWRSEIEQLPKTLFVQLNIEGPARQEDDFVPAAAVPPGLTSVSGSNCLRLAGCQVRACEVDLAVPEERVLLWPSAREVVANSPLSLLREGLDDAGRRAVADLHVASNAPIHIRWLCFRDVDDPQVFQRFVVREPLRDLHELALICHSSFLDEGQAEEVSEAWAHPDTVNVDGDPVPHVGEPLPPSLDGDGRWSREFVVRSPMGPPHPLQPFLHVRWLHLGLGPDNWQWLANTLYGFSQLEVLRWHQHNIQSYSGLPMEQPYAADTFVGVLRAVRKMSRLRVLNLWIEGIESWPGCDLSFDSLRGHATLEAVHIVGIEIASAFPLQILCTLPRLASMHLLTGVGAPTTGMHTALSTLARRLRHIGGVQADVRTMEGLRFWSNVHLHRWGSPWRARGGGAQIECTLRSLHLTLRSPTASSLHETMQHVARLASLEELHVTILQPDQPLLSTEDVAEAFRLLAPPALAFVRPRRAVLRQLWIFVERADDYPKPALQMARWVLERYPELKDRSWPPRCYLYSLQETLRVAFGACRDIEFSSKYTRREVRCLPSRPTATGCDIVCEKMEDALGHDLYETAMEAEGSLGAFYASNELNGRP